VVKIVGLKLVTHHPVIEPVSDSAPGTGIFRPETMGEIAALPRTETGIRLSEDEKPRQKRAFLDSLCKTPKRRTGWWRTQSFETSLQFRISLLQREFRGFRTF
jgi:hypothetical protein